MIELYLGGARSGKSRLAQQQAMATGLPVTYLATATADDAEMQARIDQHQADRPAHWHLREEPLQLAAAIEQAARQTPVVLVDCLTLWLSNLLARPEPFQAQLDSLLAVLANPPGHLILVSNETGLGVVPLGALTRTFVDTSGFLHQAIARLAQRVVFCVAGLPMTLKSLDNV